MFNLEPHFCTDVELHCLMFIAVLHYYYLPKSPKSLAVMQKFAIRLSNIEA